VAIVVRALAVSLLLLRDFACSVISEKWYCQIRGIADIFSYNFVPFMQKNVYFWIVPFMQKTCIFGSYLLNILWVLCDVLHFY